MNTKQFYSLVNLYWDNVTKFVDTIKALSSEDIAAFKILLESKASDSKDLWAIKSYKQVLHSVNNHTSK